MFYVNHLLADDSHEISSLISTKDKENVTKFVLSCICDWHFKGQFCGKDNNVQQSVRTAKTAVSAT